MISVILYILSSSVLNINFYTLFSEFNPHIYFGGDNVIFWGPLAWTVIYGLFVATFLTLIVVPVLFLIVERIKLRFFKKKPPLATKDITI